MKLLLASLMLLPGLSCGFLMPSDTLCKAMNDATCSVTLGGNVFFQIMVNASGYRIKFSRVSKEMFSIKKGTLFVRENAFRNRTEVFLDNGTIQIQNVQWEDAGLFDVEIHDSVGENLKTVHVMLEVKANPWPRVVFASASVGAFLMVVFISCCIYKKVKSRKHKTNASQNLNKL